MSEQNESPEQVSPHIAWGNFLLMYRPALSKYDCEEALTTDQILARLNAITLDEDYSQAMLFAFLTMVKFKNEMLEGTNTFVWFLKPAKSSVL